VNPRCDEVRGDALAVDRGHDLLRIDANSGVCSESVRHGAR
jgi:hypothetical protein